jgi:hypothetical protein
MAYFNEKHFDIQINIKLLLFYIFGRNPTHAAYYGMLLEKAWEVTEFMFRQDSSWLQAPLPSSPWPSACSLGIYLPGAPQVDILSTSLKGPHPEGIRQDMASSMLVSKEIFR